MECTSTLVISSTFVLFGCFLYPPLQTRKVTYSVLYPWATVTYRHRVLNQMLPCDFLWFSRLMDINLCGQNCWVLRPSSTWPVLCTRYSQQWSFYLITIREALGTNSHLVLFYPAENYAHSNFLHRNNLESLENDPWQKSVYHVK